MTSSLKRGAIKVLTFPLVLLPYEVQNYWLKIQGIPALVYIGIAAFSGGLILAYRFKNSILLFPICAVTLSGLSVAASSLLPIIFYPALLTAAVAGNFLCTLAAGKKPLVQQLAEQSGKILSARGIKYCRSVTLIWGIVLTLNTAVGAAAWFISPTFWKLYNGCICYVIFGAVFAIEYAARTALRASLTKSSNDSVAGGDSIPARGPS